MKPVGEAQTEGKRACQENHCKDSSARHSANGEAESGRPGKSGERERMTKKRARNRQSKSSNEKDKWDGDNEDQSKEADEKGDRKEDGEEKNDEGNNGDKEQSENNKEGTERDNKSESKSEYPIRTGEALQEKVDGMPDCEYWAKIQCLQRLPSLELEIESNVAKNQRMLLALGLDQPIFSIQTQKTKACMEKAFCQNSPLPIWCTQPV